jgi:hypothetical protein
MAEGTASGDTGMLQLESLQLDVQLLQRFREEDKKEFLDFSTSVQQNFVSIQNNFISIQANFERLFNAKKADTMEQSGHTPETPPQVGAQSAASVSKHFETAKTVGTGTLRDAAGQEMHLDGTPKLPYRHPNAGQVTTLVHDFTTKQPPRPKPTGTAVQQLETPALNGEEGNMMNSRQRAPHRHLLDMRQGTPAIKPARMNIPEFSGEDTDAWIQTIEMYFDSARTPLDRRTEIAVTYLKGDAMQWWRGTRYNAQNLPWHRFCRHLGDRFALTFVCDNLRAFHSLTQTSTVTIYISKSSRLQ